MHGQPPLTFSLVVLVNIMGDTQANVTQAFPMLWYLLDLDTVRMLKALNGFLSTSLIIHSRKEHNSCEMTSEAEIFKQRAASAVKRVHESSPCFMFSCNIN